MKVEVMGKVLLEDSVDWVKRVFIDGGILYFND